MKSRKIHNFCGSFRQGSIHFEKNRNLAGRGKLPVGSERLRKITPLSLYPLLPISFTARRLRLAAKPPKSRRKKKQRLTRAINTVVLRGRTSRASLLVSEKACFQAMRAHMSLVFLPPPGRQSAVYTTIPAAPWSSGFDIHLDDLSLEGSDEGDEDDNIAFGKVLVSVSKTAHAPLKMFPK